jgi:ankyrin repeat protein
VLLDADADFENVRAGYFQTPLLTACRYGRPELVSLLLERGANVKAVDVGGCNVLHWVVQTELLREMIPLLIKAGADVLQQSNWN